MAKSNKRNGNKGKGKATEQAKPKTSSLYVPHTAPAWGAGKPVGKSGVAVAPHKIVKSGAHGIARGHDLPWGPKKVAVFKALLAKKAIGLPAALPANVVAEAAGVSPVTVRHYIYAAKAAGLAEVGNKAGAMGYVYCLTPAGVKAFAEHSKA